MSYNMELRGLMDMESITNVINGQNSSGYVMCCEENEPSRATFNQWTYREKRPRGKVTKISINGVNKYSSMVSWKEMLRDLITDGMILQ